MSNTDKVNEAVKDLHPDSPLEDQLRGAYHLVSEALVESIKHGKIWPEIAAALSEADFEIRKIKPKDKGGPVEFTDRTRKIMGTTCFQSARFSHRLIELGVYPKQPSNHKAEYEQAIFMHWALNLEAEHGEKWFEEAQKVMFPANQEQVK